MRGYATRMRAARQRTINNCLRGIAGGAAQLRWRPYIPCRRSAPQGRHQSIIAAAHNTSHPTTRSKPRRDDVRDEYSSRIGLDGRRSYGRSSTAGRRGGPASRGLSALLLRCRRSGSKRCDLRLLLPCNPRRLTHALIPSQCSALAPLSFLKTPSTTARVSLSAAHVSSARRARPSSPAHSPPLSSRALHYWHHWDVRHRIKPRSDGAHQRLWRPQPSAAALRA